jgi:hypothetical protein
LIVVFVRGGLVPWDFIEVKDWYITWFPRPHHRPIADRFKRILGMEAEVVLIIQLRASVFLLVRFLLLRLDVLVNSDCTDVLQLLFVGVLNWVSFVLKQMYEVHDLLLAALQVVDLVFKGGAEFIQLCVLDG